MSFVRTHRATIVGALLVAAVVATSCGRDVVDSATSPTDAAADAFPLEIEHRFGTAVVDAPPERIVSLSTQWTDVLLALDVQPVGIQDGPGADEHGRYPWQDDLADGTAVIPVADGIPMEQIAALRPDLIVVTHSAEDRATYDALAAVAPTVALLGERQVDPWEDLVEVAGAFLDRPADAEALVARVHGHISSTATDLPGLAGTTFLLVNHLPGDSMWVVADESDGSSVLFASLGMSIPADVLAAADGVSGRLQVSLEQVELLDSDLLIMLNNGADPFDLIGYGDLRSVQAGAALDIDLATVIALNTPTPLGVVHALDVIRPALEAAAR